MVQEHQLSKAKACQIAGLPRAALHRKSLIRIERGAPVVSALNETVARHGRWGFWWTTPDIETVTSLTLRPVQRLRG